MPLVFVHGVNNRWSDHYQIGVLTRDALFRQFALTAFCDDPKASRIFNPYWGGAASKFPYNYGFTHDSQPEVDAFGSEHQSGVVDEAVKDCMAIAGVQQVPVNAKDFIVQIAHGNFEVAADLLLVTSATDEETTIERAAEFAEFASA